MDNKVFAKKLEERTRKFAVQIIRLSIMLPNTSEGKAVKNQLTKCGTSVGANYREANRFRSRAGFNNRIKICKSKASETQYWLEIIKELEWLPWEKIQTDYEECSELLAIFASVGSTSHTIHLRHFRALSKFNLN